MTTDTSLESSCALLLESANKFANMQKMEFFREICSYIVKSLGKNHPKIDNFAKMYLHSLYIPFSFHHKLSKKLKIIKI